MTEEDKKKISVLIVEDDKEIAYLLKFMLEREGYHVSYAADGKEAIQLIDTLTPPDLTLLDVMLPYHDGFQLIAYIRKKDGWEKIPIVMLTAKSQESSITRALEAGANDYVIKPFQPMELMARLRRFLKKSS